MAKDKLDDTRDDEDRSDRYNWEEDDIKIEDPSNDEDE